MSLTNMATNNSIQFAAFALALTCATSAAAVSPQWTIAVESRVRTQEGPSADLAGSWTSLADGSQLLAAVQRGPNGRAALRRIDGHGQIADFAALDPPVNPGEALVLLAAVQDGAYALTSATPDAHASTLYRFAADGSRQWTLRLPSKAYTGDGPAVKLLVHADGSALVLHRRSMTQVTASGEMVWQAGDGNDGQMMQDLADVLIDRQGVIWVGGRGGRAAGARQNDASLRRYSSDGSLLSLHTLPCSPCTNARVMSLAQLSDGKVVAVGRSGTNQPGFFSVRYSDGSERLLALTAPGAGYDRVVADAADNVYALSLDTRTVSAINTADGSVRWHKDGSDITALSNGVLISQSPASGTGTLSLGAFDANGDARWTRQIAANDGSTLGGARQAGGLTRVVAMHRAGRCARVHCAGGAQLERPQHRVRGRRHRQPAAAHDPLQRTR
jgi:outer membrane protein assembly factor BamB